MKKIFTILILTFTTALVPSFAQMSGTFTVNKNGIASDTNFLSFTSLTDSLRTKGVNGTITINVVANSGPYRERIEFDRINGFTERRPLLLNGNGNEIITTVDNLNQYNLLLSNVESVTVQNFKFTLRDSLAFTNLQRDNIRTNGNFDVLTIKECNIKYELVNNTTNFYGSNRRYINLGLFNSGPNYSNIRNLSITEVKANGGALFGIYSYYNLSAVDTSYRGKWLIENNEIGDVSWGIYILAHNSDSLIIDNNHIYRMKNVSTWNNNQFIGIYLYDYYYYYNNNNTRRGNTRISNNLIQSENGTSTNGFNSTGIWLLERGTSNSQIFNNIIELSARNNYFIHHYHYYFQNFKSSLEIAHNTFILNQDTNLNPQVSADFIRGNYSTNQVNRSLNINNNLFYSNASNTSFVNGILTVNNIRTDTFITISNNLFFAKNNGFNGFLQGYFCSVYKPSDTTNCPIFQSSNLLNVDPKFASMENRMYVPTNELVYRKGMPINYIERDFFGTKRSKTAPQIGAIESLDGLEITEYDTDLDTLICSNSEGEFSFIIENNTGIDLENVGVNVAVNGIVRLSESFKSDLKRGASDTFSFSKKLKFNGVGRQKIDIYALGTNLDSTHLYQTLYITLKPTPSGSNIVPNDLSDSYEFVGDSSNPDVTLSTKTMLYDLVPPKDLNIADFGFTWGINNLSFSDSISKVDTALGLFFDMPNGTLRFNPSVSLDGQRINMVYQIENYQNGCDTFVERYVRVLDTPKPRFQYNFNCLGESTQFINTTQYTGTDKLKAFWDLDEANATSEFWSTEYFYQNKGVKSVKLKIWFEEFPKYEFFVSNATLITPYPEPNFRMNATCAKSESKFIDLSTIDPGSVVFATYKWNFGDSTKLEGFKDPTHIYKSGGGYDVNLEIDILGCKSNVTKRVNVLYTPDADFEVKDLCLGDTLFVQNKSSIPQERLTVLWDFNQEGTSFATQPTFLFKEIGKKDIRLIARSEFGCADTLIKQINVGAVPEITLEKPPICVNLPATFTIKNLEDKAIISAWKWIVNGEIVSNTTTFTKKFDAIWAEPVRIEALTDIGCKAIILDTLQVLNNAIADFMVSDVCQGENASFENKSILTGGSPQYRWFFGTGDTSNEASPIYNYGNLFGTVSVTLEVTIVEGCTDQKVKMVNIAKAPSAEFDVILIDGNIVRLKAVEDDAIYRWRFKDGSRYETQTIVHIYTNMSIYDDTICLNTRNMEGCWNLEDEGNCRSFSIEMSTDFLNSSGTDIQVYPNPTKGVFTLNISKNTPNMTIQVMDMLGNMLPSTINHQTEGNYQVDLGNVSAGVYLVHVTNGNSHVTKKITVHK